MNNPEFQAKADEIAREDLGDRAEWLVSHNGYEAYRVELPGHLRGMCDGYPTLILVNEAEARRTKTYEEAFEFIRAAHAAREEDE